MAQVLGTTALMDVRVRKGITGGTLGEMEPISLLCLMMDRLNSTAVTE